MMQNLSEKQLSALLVIANRMPGFSCQGTSGKFIDLWLVAEAIAKRLIKYRTGKDVGQQWSYTEIEASVSHFGFNPPSNLSTHIIFKGGSGSEATRTPRQLRNAFMHGLSDKVLAEMNKKGDGFADLLGQWISFITTSHRNVE